MALPFVRIEQEDAVMAKKAVLSAQLNILNLAKKVSIYKRLQKSETAKKMALKRKIKRTSAQISSLIREMPEVQGASKEIIREKFSSKEKEKKKSIELELKDIQEKLSRLQR